MIGGISEGALLLPFSAPYSSLNCSNPAVKVEYIVNFISSLDNYIIQNNLKIIKVILSPWFCNENLLAKTAFALITSGYSISNFDMNYHFHKDSLNRYIENDLPKNVVKNLKRASASDLTFVQVKSEREKKECYEVVKENRSQKERPTRLAFEYILKMEKIIKVDYFIVYFGNEPAASAIVFHVAKDIVQVIYWGDLIKYGTYRPMNFLSYKVFSYYVKEGIVYIDIGPSSEKGIPNYGLCNFKENIGCTPSLKYYYFKEFCTDT